MHKPLDGNAGTDAVYRIKNINLLFFKKPHIWLKHLGIILLIQDQDDVPNICGIRGFSFYGIIFYVCAMRI